jgi:hypothetical protein
MASGSAVQRLVTVNEMLDWHVCLDLDCLDRLYLNGYLGQLQVGGQVIQFLSHRGFKVYSAACLQQIGEAFRRRVASFAEANHIPVVPLKAADRNIDVMRRYLDKAAAAGRSQVAAIGVAQEPQRVFIAASATPTRPGPRSFPSVRRTAGSRCITSTCGTRASARRSSRSAAGARGR